jgi:hypothetical protein
LPASSPIRTMTSASWRWHWPVCRRYPSRFKTRRHSC